MLKVDHIKQTMANLQKRGFFARNLQNPSTSSPVGVRLNWSRKASVPVPANSSLVFQQGSKPSLKEKPAKPTRQISKHLSDEKSSAGFLEYGNGVTGQNDGLNCLLVPAVEQNGPSASKILNSSNRISKSTGKKTHKTASIRVISRSDKKTRLESRKVSVLSEITSVGSPAIPVYLNGFCDEATRLSAGSESDELENTLVAESSSHDCESTLLFSSTESSLLPPLKTQEEKELLGEIFRQWQEEMDCDGPRISTKKLPKKTTKETKSTKRKSSSVDTDGISVSSSDLPGLVVHMSDSKRPKLEATATKIAGPPLKKHKKTKDLPPLTELTLEQFLDELPDDYWHWGINYQDNLRGDGIYCQKRDNRMRQNVCHFCGMRRRGKHHCITPCTLCYGDDHPVSICPYKDKVKTLHCARCELSGHVEAICPERWRQFHSTRTVDTPLKRGSLNKQKTVHCYNCAKSGHFGFECHKRQGFHTPASSLVVSQYDTLSDLELEGEENSLDEFHEFVRNHLTEETSEYLSGTFDQRKKANRLKQKRRKTASEPAHVLSPSKKARWRRTRKSFTVDE